MASTLSGCFSLFLLRGFERSLACQLFHLEHISIVRRLVDRTVYHVVGVQVRPLVQPRAVVLVRQVDDDVYFRFFVFRVDVEVDVMGGCSRAGVVVVGGGNTGSDRRRRSRRRFDVAAFEVRLDTVDGVNADVELNRSQMKTRSGRSLVVAVATAAITKSQFES